MTSSPARQRHFVSAWLLRPSSAAMKVNQPPDEMDVYPSNADRDLQQHPITRRCVANANLTIWGWGGGRGLAYTPRSSLASLPLNP